MMPSLTALVSLALGLGSCSLLDLDEEQLEHKIMEDVPYLTSGIVESGVEADEAQIARFDDVCTIINSTDDVYRLFSVEALAESPGIANVNYHRYSIVIYTRYLGGVPMGYMIDEWKRDKEDDVYSLSLRLGMGGTWYMGNRYLHQVAFRTKKIDSDAVIKVDCDIQ